MATLLQNITLIVNAAFGWVSTAVSTINASGNEILLLSIIIPFVGLAIGLLKRLLSVRT